MSRAKSHQNARRPQLPFTMRQELGISDPKRQRFQVTDRRQRRKEERRDNKSYSNKRQKIRHEVGREEDFEDDEEEPDTVADESSEEEEDIRVPVQVVKKPVKSPAKSVKQLSPSPVPSQASSDSEDVALDDFEADDDSFSRGSREYSPEVVLDANSTAFQSKQAEEDEEILALERKLGMKAKKSKVFDDGFDDLLDDIEEPIRSGVQDRETKGWLEQKRKKAALGKTYPEPEGSEDEFGGFDDEDENSANDLDENEDEDEGESGDEEQEDDDTKESAQPAKEVRENPYIAPTVDGSVAKYVPPSRRAPPIGDTEQLQKLRKQAQGSLNKLSEANIISIVDEFSKLYQQYPRQEVTNTTIDLILTAFAVPTTLNNTYIILFAAFVTALYKIYGADFGAEMVSKLVESSDRYHGSPGKESLNLTSLLANLFTFNLITSTLVYDHIRLLLAQFGSGTTNTEDSAEQLLRIIRDCGPQLRSDDPTSLKGIVAMMNETAAKMTSDGTKINVRTRVMMDSITDLKNNKVRHNTNSAGIAGEHLTRMRKALGTLSSRQLRGTEPLGISRADIMNSEKKGKWWLVGASWKGNSQAQSQSQSSTSLSDESSSSNNNNITTSDTTISSTTDPSDPSTIDIRSLATSYKLTTPLRLSIFTALITAHSPPDALHRLTKLRLTRRQEPEVPRVLIVLCRAEPNFNPYYAALARQLLRERKYKMPFSIALWKFFAEIGENPDQDDDGDRDAGDGGTSSSSDANIQIAEIANVARLYARMVAKGSLELDVIKTLNIGLLGEKASIWLEVFFIALLAQNKLDDEMLVKIFGTCEQRLSKSVAWFLRKYVRSSDLLVEEEVKRVKRAWKLVEATFAAVEGVGHED